MPRVKVGPALPDKKSLMSRSRAFAISTLVTFVPVGTMRSGVNRSRTCRASTGQRRSRNFTFRSRDQLHARLLAAAAKSGRSISEEIERRLEQSFHDDLLIEFMQRAFENPEKFDREILTVVRMLEAIKPAPLRADAGISDREADLLKGLAHPQARFKEHATTATERKRK